MKQLLSFTILTCAMLLFGCSEKNKTENEWKLVWEDQFETNGQPDPDKWQFAGRGTPDWACYCKNDTSTAVVRNGDLILTGKISEDPNDTARYNTGCINTKGLFSFKYGKIEVKAKVDQGKGSWPAIWLMPEDPQYGGWPYSGEIDIMEHLNFDSHVHQTVHSEYVDVLGKRDNPKYTTTAPIKPNEYNIFALEWYPDKLVFFVNGQKTLTYPKVEGATESQWPFDQPFYIILDQALGGNWVGEIHDEDLPVSMKTDWVKVYQKNSYE